MRVREGEGIKRVKVGRVSGGQGGIALYGGEEEAGQRSGRTMFVLTTRGRLAAGGWSSEGEGDETWFFCSVESGGRSGLISCDERI